MEQLRSCSESDHDEGYTLGPEKKASSGPTNRHQPCLSSVEAYKTKIHLNLRFQFLPGDNFLVQKLQVLNLVVVVMIAESWRGSNFLGGGQAALEIASVLSNLQCTIQSPEK